jgi:hypothetical protein
MKYIEVIGWGSEKKHLIPLSKIVDFMFNEDNTRVTLTTGIIINIKETEDIIKEMLSFHNIGWISKDSISTYYDNINILNDCPNCIPQK